MSNQFKRFGPITLILIAILAIIYYVLFVIGEDADALTASGTVEAVEVVVAIDTGGQIIEVMVDEGDNVKAGDELIRFKDEILQAQFEQAKETLTQAQIDYNLIAAKPLEEKRQVAIAAAQIELLSAQQALEDLIYNADLARAHAQQAVVDAEQALEDLLNPELRQAVAREKIAIAEQAIDEAEKHLRIVSSPPPQSAIDQAYANMLLAENKVNKTLDDLDMANKKLKYGPAKYWPKEIKAEYRKQFRNLIKNLEIKLAWDQLAYQNSTDKYNELLKPVDPIELALAQADLAIDQAQLEQAQREYERIKDSPSEADIAVLDAQINVAKREYEALGEGPDPDDLALAQARVRNAEAILSLAQADTIQEQLAVAQAQIEAAEVALSVIQTQLDKLVLTAPVDGTVLHRFVEAGEVVVPGRAAVTLANLDDLTITVYIPEDRYGEIDLGEEVLVTVDSFPNEAFSAVVIRIADEAEFTPRNVQTAEGRRSTVFAVELAVNDPDGVVKPGMPADVTFGE
jgi:HlyD family secretion protein